jgi:gliding motility-associated-like protein
MWHVRVLLIACSLFSLSARSQQLIINEVSQGTGAAEYVEFVVIGTPTCQSPVPCIDLRGVIIDDNNGYFAPGSGTGIASGAVRFANTSFWSCVPQGTYIVVYNEADQNPALPPDDTDLSDGNCRLVIPASSPLLEGTSVSPTSSVSTYPASGWPAGAGTWNQLAMSNSNDSFQIPNLGVNGTPLHSISWGNNTSGTIIYFAGSAGSKVFSFVNTASNDWNLQANWVSGEVGVNETPGAPNSPDNDAWIASMNPQCGINAGIDVTVQTTAVSCGASCNGTASAQVSGGTAPYTYLWSNGAATAAISDLCEGTYTVEVTDAGGCSLSAQATVQSSGGSLQFNFTTSAESCAGTCDGSVTAAVSGGTAPYAYVWSNGNTTSSITNLCPGTYTITATDQNGCAGNASVVVTAGSATADATIIQAGPFTTADGPYQLQSATNGGTWLTTDCAACLSPGGLFNPQASGAGTIQICYTAGTGSCAANDCIDIVVTQGCTPQTTEETVTFCAEDSVLVYGTWQNTPDTYSQTFTDINGCDSTHHVILLLNPVPDNEDAIGLCPGDSVLIFGDWITQTGIYTQEAQTAEGCAYTRVITVYTEPCTAEELSLFVPNTFTPNADNINDVFKIELLGAELETGYIFNRWGNQVKVFNATDLSWDGKTANGETAEDGVYTWLLYYTPAGGNRQTLHGFVTVIR